jgi:hypothetical protein
MYTEEAVQEQRARIATLERELAEAREHGRTLVAANTRHFNAANANHEEAAALRVRLGEAERLLTEKAKDFGSVVCEKVEYDLRETPCFSCWRCRLFAFLARHDATPEAAPGTPVCKPWCGKRGGRLDAAGEWYRRKYHGYKGYCTVECNNAGRPLNPITSPATPEASKPVCADQSCYRRRGLAGGQPHPQHDVRGEMQAALAGAQALSPKTEPGK